MPMVRRGPDSWEYEFAQQELDDYNSDSALTGGPIFNREEWLAMQADMAAETTDESEAYFSWLMTRTARRGDRMRDHRSQLARRYGADPEEYARVRWATHCPACDRDIKETSPQKRGLHLHHDHETKRFVAFLCWRCNMALGLMGDDPAMLRRLAEYVEPAIAKAAS